MYAVFERFELKMTKAQAESASHQGRCDEDVEALCAVPSIRKQLDKIPKDVLRAELKEYGAWDEDELKDDEQNRRRIVWLAAGNIKEERGKG